MQGIFSKNPARSLESRERGNRLRRKRHHDRNQHREILLRYSESIAFAVDKDELAKAYSNRSELLLHLREYERCLIDIERALKVAESEELKKRLKDRKKNFEDAMEKSSSSRDDSRLDLPNFEASKEMESASEAVAVKYNEKFGRHMVATRDIRPGEVIVAERAYVCFPIVARRHLVCSHCLSFAWNGIPCDHCAFAMYCSETCKTDAWSEYHDVECKLLPISPLAHLEAGNLHRMRSLLAVLRMLIKAVKSEGIDAVIGEFLKANSENCKGVDGLKVEGKFRSDKFRSCVNLLSHDDAELPTSIQAAIPILIDLLLMNQESVFHSDGKEMKSQLVTLVKKLIRIYGDNAFEYQAFICECAKEVGPDLRDYVSQVDSCDAHPGGVLAPFSSLISHSCCFNVNRLFLPNGKVAMFTVAPVEKGEQLFISYGVGLTLRKEERRPLLQRLFHFTCACRACEENWPTDQKQIELSLDQHEKALTRVNRDFYKSFPKVSPDSFSLGSYDNWTFDEKTLKGAVKFSELNYKHFRNLRPLAAYCSNESMLYTTKAFYALYGEKFATLDKCQ